MDTTQTPKSAVACPRYSLLAMFQFVTICSVLCALIPVVGPWSGALLMLVTLALVAGQGELTIGSLVLAVALDPVFHETSIASQLTK